MTTENLSILKDKLSSLGIKDITQSLLVQNTELEMGTGLMKALSYIPDHKAEELIEFSAELSNTYSAENYCLLLKAHGFLDFEPYILDSEKYGKVIVCGINMFVVYHLGYFKVVTELDREAVLSCSAVPINSLIEILKTGISTDAYNAILATLLCTAFMCKTLRENLRTDGKLITEFLMNILKDCKAPQIYSVDTFKSKLSWVNLEQKHNYNYNIRYSGRLLYQISIGSDATTIRHLLSTGNISHVSFLYDQSKLTQYDCAFKIKSSYFAYALYLLVSDVFTKDFAVEPRCEIAYTDVDDISKMYFI